MTTSRIRGDEFLRVLQEGMPSAVAMAIEVLAIDRGQAVLRMPTGPGDLRPGNTVSGPAVFALADLAMYAAVMSTTGPVPLVVTTDATIHFLRRPRAGMLVARARLLKEGKRLVVGEVTVVREGEDSAPIAHIVMTYSVPPALT